MDLKFVGKVFGGIASAITLSAAAIASNADDPKTRAVASGVAIAAGAAAVLLGGVSLDDALDQMAAAT